MMSMAKCSCPKAHLASLPQPSPIPKFLVFSKPCLSLKSKNHPFLLVSRSAATDNGSGGAALTVEEKDKAVAVAEEPKVESNGSLPVATPAPDPVIIPKFEDPRWINGTWDLTQFQKDQKTDWDAVIDAEARRRKWLEQYPESSSNEDPVFFDTSIVPWWAWV